VPWIICRCHKLDRDCGLRHARALLYLAASSEPKTASAGGPGHTHSAAETNSFHRR